MRTICAAVAVFGLMVAGSWADDQVKLKNGDTISGKVTSLAGGKLVVETPYAGKVTIDWAQVVSVKTDGSVKVTLATGEILEGKIVPGADGRLKVETSGAAAPVEVELGKIKYFNQPPTQWHGNLTASGKITEGNTRTKAFLISAEGTRETEQDLFILRAVFHYGQQAGVLTERNTYGIGKYQYKFTPALYGYLSEELISDTFKDIGLQSITSIGMGYDLIKESWLDFSMEAGAAYFSITHKLIADESYMGARIAAKMRLALPLGFELKDIAIVYPDFKDGNAWQLRNEATLGTALGAGWNLVGGVITEFNHKPVPGFKTTDDTYFIGLGYTF